MNLSMNMKFLLRSKQKIIQYLSLYKMEHNIIEEQNIIEEPVVKRGRGRPRVIK